MSQSTARRSPTTGDIAHRMGAVATRETAVRPPLVRSTVYVLRVVIGLLLLLFGMGILLVFENGLLGIKTDIETLQESWPGWLDHWR